MATKEDLLVHFESFNINPSEQVISRCLEMCFKHKFDAETLIDQWFAYTSSKLRGAAPTVEYLDQMERKILKSVPPGPEQHLLSPVARSSNQSTVPNSDTALLSTPKGNHAPVSRIQTPIQARKLDESMDSNASPGGSSGTYSKRTDALSVRCTHGSKQAKFKRTSNLDLLIKPMYEDGLKPNQLIMYEILRKRVRCIDNMTEDLVNAIAQKYNIPLHDENNDSRNALVYGRIISDSDGKINNQSILLEQTQSFRGRCFALNLSNMSKYSLFSGQCVVVRGTYLKAHHHKMDKILAEEIYSNANFSLLPEPPLLHDTMQVVVACGPFTVQDSLTFEPLNDLLQYVKEHKPHVLILAGPFYDKNHEAIHNGELRQSFDSFFFGLIDTIMTEIQQHSHVIIVSSQKEPHHFAVYPTPPYEVRHKYANLTFMPDPCLVNINGLVIGTTTADILFDIGSFEQNFDKTNSGPPDRLGRLASHLLEQQSFYPLDPPGKEMSIDFSLMERHGVMAVKPHILILPSNFRHFVKEIDNCLVVNPERLCKGNGGGTFARLEVYPGSNPTVCGRTACQILRI